MDMSHHEPDHEPDEFEVHGTLAEAIVKMMCVALLPLGEDTVAHQADMATVLDLIALKVLQHNFHPHEVRQALDGLALHAEHVAQLLVLCAREAGIECAVKVDVTVERR